MEMWSLGDFNIHIFLLNSISSLTPPTSTSMSLVPSIFLPYTFVPLQQLHFFFSFRSQTGTSCTTTYGFHRWAPQGMPRRQCSVPTMYLPHPTHSTFHFSTHIHSPYSICCCFFLLTTYSLSNSLDSLLISYPYPSTFSHSTSSTYFEFWLPIDTIPDPPPTTFSHSITLNH